MAAGIVDQVADRLVNVMDELLKIFRPQQRRLQHLRTNPTEHRLFNTQGEDLFGMIFQPLTKDPDHFMQSLPLVHGKVGQGFAAHHTLGRIAGMGKLYRHDTAVAHVGHCRIITGAVKVKRLILHGQHGINIFRLFDHMLYDIVMLTPQRLPLYHVQIPLGGMQNRMGILPVRVVCGSSICFLIPPHIPACVNIKRKTYSTQQIGFLQRQPIHRQISRVDGKLRIQACAPKLQGRPVDFFVLKNPH